MSKSETSLAELLYDIRRIEEHREKLSEKKIRKIYKSLMRDLRIFLAEGYEKYADTDGRFYLSYLDAQNQRAKFLEEIVSNVDGISPQIREEIISLVDETYSSCYIGMSEAVKKAQQSGTLAAITQDIDVQPDVLAQAVNNNIGKLTLPAVLEKSRHAIIYDIQQILVTGLTNGDRYDQMIKRVSKVLSGDNGSGGYYGKAVNIVRTESHRNVENGFMDCAERIQEGVEGSDFIYAVTWRTMQDERVRPQIRYKTKSGWKTKISKNGADHTKMEGVTVKVGDMFTFSDGVKTKNPSRSGYARHDCNCRCFLEYNLMTLEEFEAATKKAVNTASVHKSIKRLMNESGIPDVDLQRTTDATAFDNAIQRAIKSQPVGGCVDAHPLEELQEFKLFLSSNQMAGVAVKPDGDITAVFKNFEFKQRGAVSDLIITARANGGVKMDCYGVGLVNMYERCGYVPVARVAFNPDYVSDPYLLQTRPDVYVMMKNTDDIETVIRTNAAKGYKLSSQAELDGLPTFEYDDALSYRDKLLGEQENR